ncbi:MAG: gamma-glutamylcyclotransferase family protein [Bryobacteraceae bacterium]|jgi:hypothetical protein
MDSTTELASGFTVGRYCELRPDLTSDEPQSVVWHEVLGAMRRRIDERFLKPIHGLARFDKRDELPNRPGFAILALDCLLIDTIQSFREGRASTGEVSPAHSFKTFLSSPNFSDFKKNERGEFFQYVRNAILHNGETRKDWRIRIDTRRMLERDPKTKTRTINRRLFHAAVIREFRRLHATLRAGDSSARKQFLRRMDAMAGLPVETLRNLYFAYGSNLLEAECLRTAPDAQPYGSAFLPGYRLAFLKHSTTRGGDAATILPDANSMVWGFVYRVHDKDRQYLRAREGGYEELPETTVYFVAPMPGDDPTPITVFTFAATRVCPKQCRPPATHLDLIIEGARARGLPAGYQERLSDLRQKLDETTNEDA